MTSRVSCRSGKRSTPPAEEAVKIMEHRRAGIAGVPACPRRKETIELHQRPKLCAAFPIRVALDAGRRGRLRSQHDDAPLFSRLLLPVVSWPLLDVYRPERYLVSSV